MSYPYAIQWFSDKKQLLSAMAVVFRVQAAGMDRTALSSLAPEIRKLIASSDNDEALSWLGFSQTLLYLHLGKHSRAIETVEKSIPLAARSARTILPGLVAAKAFSMAASGVHDEERLKLLRKQMKSCTNTQAEVRSAAVGAVAMAHYFNHDVKRARKLMDLAISINPQQAKVEVEFDFPSKDVGFEEWKQFVQEEFVDTKRRKLRA